MLSEQNIARKSEILPNVADFRKPSVRTIPALDSFYEEAVFNEPVKTRWQQWLEWVEKNAQPKVHKFKKVPLPKTRWSKSPMTEEDWNEFDEWVKNRALPIEELPEPKPPKRKRAKLEELLPRIEEISEPRQKRKKFDLKKTEPTFMPSIRFGKPPRKENSHKVKKLHIRKCLPNTDAFSEYFRFQFNFKISPDALKYKPTNRILYISVPKKIPPDPHCPLPPEEIIPGRIKMTSKQWSSYLRQLKYLSMPRKILEPPEEKPLPRGKTKPLYLLEPRCEKLSQPKKYYLYKKREGVKKSALKAEASPRLIEMSKPKIKKKKYKYKEEGSGVKKSALSYVASERINKISQPKKYPKPKRPRRHRRKKRTKTRNLC